MIPDYLRWASGPQDLQRLGALVAQARARVAYLRQAPDDAAVRRDVVRLAGAIVAHADEAGWDELGDVAGPLVRLLSTRRGDTPVFDELEHGFAHIEELVEDGLAPS